MKISEKDGYSVVRFDKPAVAVICYEKDSNDILSSIGVVKELNPHFEKGYTENLVMGGVEEEDSSLLSRAMIELKEEAGLEIKDSKKWSYLGEINTSKISPDPIYLFAVNASGYQPQVPKGDKDEKIISFSMKPVQEALLDADAVTISAFFKLFMDMYKQDLKTLTV